MKTKAGRRAIYLLGLTALLISPVHAGDVKVTVSIKAEEGTPSTTFAPDTPKLLAIFKTDGVHVGDKIRGVWIAENVGPAAPPWTKIYETTVDADGDTSDGEFSLSKPLNGWPPGQYRVEIYVNEKLAAIAKFRVG